MLIEAQLPFGMRRGTAPWGCQAMYPRVWKGNTACRLGRAAPYLLTDLETGLCFYRAWQVSRSWEPGLGAAALGREFSSPLAPFFTSPCSGTTCVCGAALPGDPERSALVLRKQIVLGSRRGVMGMGQELYRVRCWGRV